jgi:hypothetical protein
MDMDTGHPAVGKSHGTALSIDDKAMVVTTEGDTQETPLVIDEEEMLPDVQITILVEDITVVNNVKQRIEHPVSLIIPANAGDHNHIPISSVSEPWAKAYPGFDENAIPANWDSFKPNDIHPLA